MNDFSDTMLGIIIIIFFINFTAACFNTILMSTKNRSTRLGFILGLIFGWLSFIVGAFLDKKESEKEVVREVIKEVPVVKEVIKDEVKEVDKSQKTYLDEDIPEF